MGERRGEVGGALTPFVITTQSRVSSVTPPSKHSSVQVCTNTRLEVMLEEFAKKWLGGMFLFGLLLFPFYHCSLLTVQYMHVTNSIPIQLQLK